MVNFRLKYGLFVIWMLLSYIGTSQGHLFSEVSIDKSSVFKAEPIEVRVSVFTSTWFTKGVDPGNIKVDGAFTIYFRSVSETRKVNGKTYAGVTMIFNVFPYENNDIIFPSVNFKVETPDEGGYKGVQRTIQTKAKTIKVKPIPEGYDISQWLVSSNVKVEENWIGNVNNVKAGDVLERTITRTVAGNVAGLIPPLAWDTISEVSTYITRSITDDVKTRTTITAKRTDGIKYLFEKEGEVILPEMLISWWDPANKRFYKRTLKERTIEVQFNPNPEMLESIRDSLLVQNQVAIEKSKKGDFEIFGLSVKEFVTIVVLAALLIYFLIKGIKKINFIYRKRKQEYLQSELYYFRIFQKAARLNNPDKILSSLYRWIDSLQLSEPTLFYFTEIIQDEDLFNEIKIINGKTESGIKLNSATWRKARNTYLHRKNSGYKIETELWIN